MILLHKINSFYKWWMSLSAGQVWLFIFVQQILVSLIGAPFGMKAVKILSCLIALELLGALIYILCHWKELNVIR